MFVTISSYTSPNFSQPIGMRTSVSCFWQQTKRKMKMRETEQHVLTSDKDKHVGRIWAEACVWMTCRTTGLSSGSQVSISEPDHYMFLLSTRKRVVWALVCEMDNSLDKMVREKRTDTDFGGGTPGGALPSRL